MTEKARNYILELELDCNDSATNIVHHKLIDVPESTAEEIKISEDATQLSANVQRRITDIVIKSVTDLDLEEVFTGDFRYYLHSIN